MVFQYMIRYAPDAVGLKPSAMGSEARLRGLDRIHFWKTMTPTVGADRDDPPAWWHAPTEDAIAMGTRAGHPRTQEGWKR